MTNKQRYCALERIICDHYEERKYLVPRQYAIKLSKDLGIAGISGGGMSFKRLGIIIGKRDHSTMLHAIKSCNDRLDTEEQERKTYRILRSKCLPLVRGAKMKKAAYAKTLHATRKKRREAPASHKPSRLNRLQRARILSKKQLPYILDN
jgi:hypothetical protein